MKSSRGLLIPLILIVFAVTSSFAAPSVPETLTYKLLWAGVGIGNSSIETLPNDNGLEIVSRVATTSWSRLFYKVEDVETSLLRPVEDGFALNSFLMHLQEGSNSGQRIFTVDPSASQVEQVNLTTFEKQTYPFVSQIWDPVSSLYYLRRIPLSPGLPVKLSVIDRQGPQQVEVTVLRKETVTTAAGTFRTLVVRSQMNLQREGLFYAPGPLTVWLTDDDQRVPVVIEKRIQGLFDRGVPAWLKLFVPASVKKDPVTLETIRAELIR